jgi:branched-chain amino acid transport system ATP-binding protein
VQDLTFSVKQGSIMAIIGPNGAGKTTVFNLIAGTLVPHSGSVVFRGTPITRRRPHRIAAMGIARTFQTTRLFPHMTVLENVMVGRHVRSRAGFVAGMLNLPWTWREERAVRDHAREILERLDLGAYEGETAGNLSFGQQRRVEFARALAVEPVLLLLDEPAAGLNIYETGELARDITRIRGWGITCVIVEHDMSLVMDISEEIVVLDHGQKIAEGPPLQIQRNPEVIRIYLGEDDA